MHLIASDFDGTIKIDNDVTLENIKAITKFREKGNKFIIVTGRSINSVLDQLETYKILYDYIIGVNGAILVDKEKEIIYAHDIPSNLFSDVFRFMENNDVVSYQISNGIDYVRINIGEASDSPLLNDKIRGLYIALEDEEKAEAFSVVFNKEFKDTELIAYSNYKFVSVGLKGIHKGYGIKRLLSEINFTSEVSVVGDDFNDIPMFKAFESYGIKTGKEDAIKYAKYEIESVSKLIEKIMEK